MQLPNQSRHYYLPNSPWKGRVRRGLWGRRGGGAPVCRRDLFGQISAQDSLRTSRPSAVDFAGPAAIGRSARTVNVVHVLEVSPDIGDRDRDEDGKNTWRGTPGIAKAFETDAGTLYGCVALPVTDKHMVRCKGCGELSMSAKTCENRNGQRYQQHVPSLLGARPEATGTGMSFTFRGCDGVKNTGQSLSRVAASSWILE
ncbi:hypothetical protein POSPLADRAFT_1140851 [Postia placenta MAD-698-R-SB12]|uniref:Uncharacterized protein n=1 Tax=Postia placenta MAD-698-R-SB12 TaxID=670580 RepID=A0A1X6N2E5_9APHY|nr:hypothetical protein POSPLADRAFT_1140851 [Postia placenta MAD-698-R-SB12]OSX62778.1 hypothetical protein POSPLADRAFT_1140851 [Postia placenta MAD-698-R-SB12]